MNNITRKAIAGYEDLYDVDELGNIYSLPKNNRPECLLKFKPDAYGYLRVGLSKNNKCKTLKAHRVVAIAFISNPLNLPQVNHKNGVKTDNRVINLEWATAKTNIRHSWNLGLSKAVFGDKNGNTSLSEGDRISVVKYYAMTNLTQKEIASKFNISQATVSLTVKNYLKKHFIEAGLAIDKTKIKNNE